MSTQETVLVTGASGHLGRQALQFVLNEHKGKVIATTRKPEQLAGYAGKDVEIRKADFDKPEELVKAFAGADRLLFISTDAVEVPGKRLQQHVSAVQAAEEAGVKHVVYTSIPNPEPPSPLFSRPITSARNKRYRKALWVGPFSGTTFTQTSFSAP